MQEKKGISLIVLVITIIILAILAATAVLVLTDGGILEYANKSSFKSRASGYVEELSTYHARKLAENKLYDYTSVNASKGGSTEIKSIIKGIAEEDEELFVIVGGVLKILNTASDQQKEIATDLGIDVGETTLAPGLYQTGTTTLIKSWEELKAEGLVTVTNGVLNSSDWDDYGMDLIAKNLPGDLVISDEVTTIAFGAFNHNSTLTNVIIPESVTTTECYSFADCSFTTITIPKSTNLSECMLSSTPIKSIIFTGTMAEWQALEKYDDNSMGCAWNAFDDAEWWEYTVTCSDGVITETSVSIM